MVTYYCPSCWREVEQGETVCDACGASIRELVDHRSFVQKLVAALSHPEPQTPVRAAWLLGNMRAAEAVGPLIELVRRVSRDVYMQAAAVEALGKIGTDDVWPIIEEMAGTGPILARRAAVAALRNRAVIAAPEKESLE